MKLIKNKWLLIVVAWWTWLPLVAGLFYLWATHGPFAPNGYGWVYELALGVKAGFLMSNASAGYYILVGALGTIGIALFAVYQPASWDNNYNGKLKPNRHTWITLVVAGVLAITSVVSLVMIVGWENGKDFGKYYANSTVFYVKDVHDVPDSLKNLATDAQFDVDGCDLLGVADVRGCVKQGELPSAGWDGRISSLEGATLAIRRKTDGVQRVSLDEQTVTYLNARGNQSAMWSGVLDGSGKEQSLYGVAEWTGSKDPKVCQFEGQYAIKRAFSGERGNSLGNYIHEKYPNYRWNMSDVWGYCDGDQPIVVIPLTQPMKWLGRSVDTAAGVLVVQGDNGNEPKLTYKPEVKQGEFPGPVYPDSLVAVQREEAKWAAGRKNMDRYSFGYDPSNSEVQSGNPAEYLLRDKTTGRLVFVTPLTLRSSSSEVFVAYSVTYADEVQAGSLNELSIYVLGHNDPRLVNIDQLSAEANDWMAKNAGMFRANQGKLIEFTPIDGDVWRVFGELGGQVVYQLDISASRKIAPVLVSVGAYGDSPTPSQQPGSTAGQSVCGDNIAALDNSALAECLRVVTGEIQSRLQTAGK